MRGGASDPAQQTATATQTVAKLFPVLIEAVEHFTDGTSGIVGRVVNISGSEMDATGA